MTKPRLPDFLLLFLGLIQLPIVVFGSWIGVSPLRVLVACLCFALIGASFYSDFIMQRDRWWAR